MSFEHYTFINNANLTPPPPAPLAVTGFQQVPMNYSAEEIRTMVRELLG